MSHVAEKLQSCCKRLPRVRVDTSKHCHNQVQHAAHETGGFPATRCLLVILSAGEAVPCSGGVAALEHLHRAAQCYATALKLSPKELRAHIGLGLAMEEFFYAEDLFGLKREASCLDCTVGAPCHRARCHG